MNTAGVLLHLIYKARERLVKWTVKPIEKA